MTIPELFAALQIFDKHGDGDVGIELDYDRIDGHIRVTPCGDLGADASRIASLGWWTKDGKDWHSPNV